MKYLIRIIVFAVIFVLEYMPVKAQKLCWETSYDLIADNREYFNVYATEQTILGARFDLHGGFELDSLNSFYVGASHLIEFGHPIDGHQPVMDLFYNYKNEKITVFLGSFPRKGLLHYPLIMLTDSVEYYRPNIQGGLGRYDAKWGYQQVWIDWTSRQTETVRETFLTGVSGMVKFGPLFVEDHFHYWHRAGMANDSVRDVRDNSSYGLLLGLDLKQFVKIDSLTIKTGLISTADRNRSLESRGDWSFGSFTKVVTRLKKIGLDLTYYYGDAPSLEYGDKIYTSGNYLRTDIIWMPFVSKYVKSKFDLGIHIVDGELDYSQQILVTVMINNKSR